ncbi:uncharacterized protein LOC111715290 isoform X2 [Eurytemora carolleeae]|uniref:uncharacterized protein LOC111715290 isoform X2 n=1 Tax=Eurytemora carolleeae TaxID=1294199 RepID=UPI000C76276F|nr:uncharacterized protein LOC111715290 isoform X2 [Eurytemora carolleeae]|eukprot:XP_023346376.1 uncharacterized protein LOC111715290 isoform X2 [Eurytemora affinis]
MAFWQENLPFIKGFFDERSQKFFDLMDRAEASIAQVNADKIYTSKEFKRIKDNFQNIVKNLERGEVRDWLNNTKQLLAEEKKGSADDNLVKIFTRFESLMPRVNETKLVTDMLWKSYEFTDDLVPLMEFANEQLGAATREVFSGSVSQTEEIIDKHNKTMDKIDKKAKEVKDVIAKGEKLAGEAKAPEFLAKKLTEMKDLWKKTTDEAKNRLADLKGNSGAWNAFADKCALLNTHVLTAQKQIADVKKLYDMDKAKSDHADRMNKAAAIKAEIDRTLAGVEEANAVLQILADDGVKAQLTQEVTDLKTACEVRKELDAKLAWLDNFNKSIIEFDKTATDLENLVAKDRADLDALIKPPEKMKSTDRLVSAMDLADDIRAQKEIHEAKQKLWSEELEPVGKENTPEAKEFVNRMTIIGEKLDSLEKEADGEAAKYGNDIVFMAEFANSKNQFMGWIQSAEEKAKKGYASPNNLEESTALVNDCKEWKIMCDKVEKVLQNGKLSSAKMTLHADEDKEMVDMMARWDAVNKACIEWSKKLEELSGMWSKQTDMLNKVTSTMVTSGGTGEQVNLNELDQQMEAIKEMFVKKQEMMKKMSTAQAPDPAQLAA